MKKKIECVIMDWAVLLSIMDVLHLYLLLLRVLMLLEYPLQQKKHAARWGRTKIDHIRALFQMERIGEAFTRNMDANIKTDVCGRYAEFQRLLFCYFYVNIQVPTGVI